jgi:hypothetical protein
MMLELNNPGEYIMTTQTQKISIVDLTNTRADPIVRRRELCISRLRDQISLLNDANFTRVITRWSGKGENRKSSEKKIVVRPWWSGVKNGVAFRLRFVSGRQGFSVGTMQDLPGAIVQLIEQINSGELDSLIVRPKVEKVKPTIIVGKDAKPEPVAAPKKSWRKSA